MDLDEKLRKHRSGMVLLTVLARAFTRPEFQMFLLAITSDSCELLTIPMNY